MSPPEIAKTERLKRWSGRDKHFVVAVQWHPEDQIALYPEQLTLFQRFAEACQKCPE